MSPRICLKDNSSLDRVLTAEELVALAPILNRPLGQLHDEHQEKLLIFPHSLSIGGGDGAEEASVLTTQARKAPQSGAWGTTVRAGNLAGFISSGGVQVSILSRFCGEQAAEEGKAAEGVQDHFLHYLLRKVLSINITSLPHRSSGEQLFDFLPYFFPTLLNRAMRQGLCKEYRREQYNDARLRGRLDVARHLRQNLPFTGRVAYSTREFSHDNMVTQLVRHTIEHLRLHYEGVLSANATCRENVATIISATPSYKRQERGRVLQQKTRCHPYYTEYAPLQTLCRSILLHERLSYGQEDREVSGILFDVAWLWEEYLWTLLEPLGFKHPRNKNRRHPDRIHLAMDGENKKHFARFPDFYREEAPGIVIDAKYKWMTSESSNISDVHQVITYMHRLQAQHGILLLPPQGAGWSYSLLRRGGTPDGSQLTSRHFGIPEGLTRYEDFSRAMEDREKALLEYLLPLLQHG